MYKTLHEEIYGICFVETGYPSKWVRHDACPCCGSGKIFYFFDKFNIAHWSCKACNFVFVNPYPDDPVVKRLYNASYYPSVRQYIEIPKALKGIEDASESMGASHYREVIGLISKYGNRGAWLDVGGGIGTFLHLVKKQLPDFTLYLNETNEHAAGFARGHYGLNVLSFSPSEMIERGLHFNVITMLSVLEHANGPRNFIKDYANLLQPGGVFLICVPHYTTLNRIFSKQYSYNVIPPYHLCFFNKRNLKIMVERAFSFEKVEIMDAGTAAFSFTHLARLSPDDIVVPDRECEEQEIIYKSSLSPARGFFLKLFSECDRFLGRAVKKADGGEFLYAVALNNE